MTTVSYARVVGGVVAEPPILIDASIVLASVFSAAMVAELVAIPAAQVGEVSCGWTYADGGFSEPVAVVLLPAVPTSVSRRQFFQAAAQSGLITNPDALAIFTTGAIPANLATALATMPAADQFAAEIAILGNATFERANPLVAELGAAMSQTSAQIDALFILAASL